VSQCVPCVLWEHTKINRLQPRARIVRLANTKTQPVPPLVSTAQVEHTNHLQVVLCALFLCVDKHVHLAQFVLIVVIVGVLLAIMAQIRRVPNVRLGGIPLLSE